MAGGLKLLIVAGARPNFMKVAPLIHAIERHNNLGGNGNLPGRDRNTPGIHRNHGIGCSDTVISNSNSRPIEYKLVHTGQHYDAKMSDIFFAELGIPTPDVNLEVGSGSHAVQTASIMLKFEPVLLEQKPDWVVVVGDVNSTMACTLVAAKSGVKVAHVEAGLRSFDRAMPEEVNRIVTDALAELLLTPSEEANENLRREGVPEARIRLVGNIMIDSLVEHLKKGAANGRILNQLQIKERGYVYVTLHRPSNVDNRETLATIIDELSCIATQLPVVFPIHPRTRHRMQEFGLSLENQPGVKLLDPVGYNDSVTLTQHARCILTDSGGLQEESTYFRTPCLTLRPNTERPVTVAVGSNRLTTPAGLRADFARVLGGADRQGAIPPLWDGRTAERIIACLFSA